MFTDLLFLISDRPLFFADRSFFISDLLFMISDQHIFLRDKRIDARLFFRDLRSKTIEFHSSLVKAILMPPRFPFAFIKFILLSNYFI